MVAERLCGSIPMTTWPIAVLLLDPAPTFEPGGQRYFEQNKPLLSLSLLTAAPGPRRPCESHTPSVGSRFASDGPGTWADPRQAPARSQVKQVADVSDGRPFLGWCT